MYPVNQLYIHYIQKNVAYRALSGIADGGVGFRGRRVGGAGSGRRR